MPSKRKLLSFLVVAGLIVTFAGAYAQVPCSRFEKEALAAIDEEQLSVHLNFLSDSVCAGRATGTAGNMEAAMWIAGQFKRCGLRSMTGRGYMSRFRMAGGKVAHNVIGFLPSTSHFYSGRYIIVAANYDHLGVIGGKMYPGADSNASGVVAMTALAEMFGHMRSVKSGPRTPIIFVGFDAKEHSLAGAEDLWQMICNEELIDPTCGIPIKKSDITLMVNLDQIGGTQSPVSEGRKDYLLMLGNDSLPIQLRGAARTVNNYEGCGLDLCYSYYGSERFTKAFYRLSNQRFFVDARIPAVLFTSGISMDNNKTWDTADKCDIPILHKRIRFIYHWLFKVM